VPAVLRVRQADVQLTHLSGEAVNVESVDGLAYPGEGEHEAPPTIQTFNGDVGSTPWQIATLQLRSDGTARIDGPEASDLETPIISLYKGPESLAFAFTAAEQCVLPKQPKAYCMTDATDSRKRLAFYIDPTPHSKPQALTNVQRKQDTLLGIEQAAINFTSETPLSLVHVIVTTPPQMFSGEASEAQHHYLPVRDSAVFAQGVYALRTGTTYELVVPAAQRAEIAVSGLDGNLRETTAINI
jgi:hypothetical protein